MYILGLTGGIGSGKSTVATMLADRGAVVIDADVLAREVVEPGTDGFHEVVDAFGAGVVGSDGSLDRQALAGIVFDDPERRRLLESIIHPRVGLRVAERLGELAGTHTVIVLDIPLLAETRSATGALAQEVLVVTASEATQLERLEAKGMSRGDAEARIRAQASPEERLALADYVISNDGSLEALEAQVAELWPKLEAKAKEPA